MRILSLLLATLLLSASSIAQTPFYSYYLGGSGIPLSISWEARQRLAAKFAELTAEELRKPDNQSQP